ncbi:MAG: SgcQ protein, partial [Clostridia bacterium]|nr:SgcQ protein [Clostridia bacterium]MBQ1772141.1 SgcQ protein [Clostridia bacterium]MBQ3663084.1 SgcQ protein [Clostridia bacterium]MBQ3663851.1 SgcQ protein [Clostridia bacterium]
MSWLKETIGTEKAIIAMCHLDALPGDPSYGGSMDEVIDHAR